MPENLIVKTNPPITGLGRSDINDVDERVEGFMKTVGRPNSGQRNRVNSVITRTVTYRRPKWVEKINGKVDDTSISPIT